MADHKRDLEHEDDLRRAATVALVTDSAGHQVVVIDAPAGHSRSEIFRMATAEGARDVAARVCAVATPTGSWSGEQYFAAVAAAVLGSTADPTPTDASFEKTAACSISSAVETIRNAVQHRPLTILSDDIHRGGESTINAAGQLARQLPAGARLCIAGVGLDALSIGDLYLSGDARFVGLAELPAFEYGGRAETTQLLNNALQHDVGAHERLLLEAVVGLRVRSLRIVETVAHAIGCTTSLALLSRLPLVKIGAVIDIDERWSFVTSMLDDVTLIDGASAAAQRCLDDENLDEAGRLAIVARSANLLQQAVRDALRSQPPSVGAHTLRAWHESELLDANDPHAWWLETSSRAVQGAALSDVFAGYERARQEFGERGDVTAEIAVGMAAAIVARRLDDFGSVAKFATRAGELLKQGHNAALGPAKLGQALGLQMGGDPAGALATLESIPVGTFEGDWSAQVDMMRATNLLLLGRLEEATHRLQLATGTGGAWSQSVALDLLATVRWTAGDRVQAIADIEAAEGAANAASASGSASHIRAMRLVMLSADGDPEAERLLHPSRPPHSGHEAAILFQIARVLVSIDRDRIEEATGHAAELHAPERTTRATFWTVALQTALRCEGSQRWHEVAQHYPALSEAIEAGNAGANFLAGGQRAPQSARAFLPTKWCVALPAVVELQLLGGATVRRNRRHIVHRNWERSRVRELCLYLSIVNDSSRELCAERLWPDLSTTAATQNLRVTLSYLLDVVDPDRQKGGTTRFFDDADGAFRFADTEDLRIDIRTTTRSAQSILTSSATDPPAQLIAHARSLVRAPRGRILAGATLGDWADDYLRNRRETLLRAIGVAAPLALRSGLGELTEQLASIGLDEDPWAERLHQLAVQACLARDDLDAARRAMRRGIAALAELGVRPEHATADLAYDLGIPLR